ncbi:MAG: zinc-ribbon domain-containing protein [Bacilli bacterium]|nr:zinc-ribbon domain-containing protein [Bacilli bacterium]MDD7315527.1 zinc-ribbon domain-containing protein [Bacilli bacterium]
MNYCRKCGLELKPDDSFCPNCGTDLTENEERKFKEAEVSEMSKEEKNRKAWIPLTLGILALINTILYVVMIVTERSNRCCVVDRGITYLILINVLCGVGLSYLFSIITGIKYLKHNGVLSKISLIGLILGSVATFTMMLLVLFIYFV